MGYSDSLGQEKLEENSDWSSRHVRLKFQMVLATFFFFVVVVFDPVSINLIGLEIFLDDTLSSRLLFWIGLIYCLFAILAFVIRSFFEYSKWTSLRKDLMNVIKRIKINEVEAANAYQNVKKMSIIDDLDEAIIGPNDEFDETVQNLVSQLLESEQRGEIRHLLSVTSNIISDVELMEYSVETIRPGAHPKISSYENASKRCSDAARSITNSVENITRYLSDLTDISESKTESVKSNIGRYNEKVQELQINLPILDGLSTIILNSEHSRNYLYFFQNFAFSVFLPILASLALIVLALLSKCSVLNLV